MKKYGSFNLISFKDERDQKYKFVFLSSVFLLDGIVAFMMGFFRWQAGPLMGMLDFGFAGLCIALLLYLRKHREQVDRLGSIVLALSFAMFFTVYILAPYNTTRLSLFFLLLSGAFF
jgi:hypothetical protein